MAKAAKNEPVVLPVRCAIYCRVSSDEKLDRDFNSMDAQREAGESFIASQRGEGWVPVEERYDDPGVSGGTMERPALKRLLADVERGRIDCIVVYKVDRLSRSLLDFSRIVETLDNHEVKLVAVTQPINTTTSMGRLTLNVLLSFAQFEREVAGERIADKIAAAKRKGKFLGSTPVLGYDIATDPRRLVVNRDEAKLVRWAFRRVRELGAATTLVDELNERGHVTKQWTTRRGLAKGGRPWDKGGVYRLLNNRLLIGEIVHKGESFPGEHEAIVSRKLWDEVHAVLEHNHEVWKTERRTPTPALLKGLIRCQPCGHAMAPTFTRKKGRTYRYYQCVRAAKCGAKVCPVGTVPAGTIEDAVIGQLRAVFRTPEIIARTYRAVKEREAAELERLRQEQVDLEATLARVARGGEQDQDGARHRFEAVSADVGALVASGLEERDVVEALTQLDGVWDELFPAERARLVELLVESIEVGPEGLDLRVRVGGLRSLVAELGGTEEKRAG